MCRGADPNDNNPSHFEVFPDVDGLEGCKDLCRIRSDCVGIESIGRRGAAQSIVAFPYALVPRAWFDLQENMDIHGRWISIEFHALVS